MPTLTGSFSLQYNQRGITIAQIISIFTFLLNVQKAAPTGYGVNVSAPNINDDMGIVQAAITLTVSQTSAFVAADLQNILIWVQTNIITPLPVGVGLMKSYSWLP